MFIRLYALARLLRLVFLIFRWGISPFFRWLLRLPPDPIPLGQRIRRVLQSLGMTFSKFGQYLATRFDLLPEAVYREMQLFFESVPPFPFPEVRRQVERELGGPLEQFFREFEETPVASASIGQVHRALTIDGERVAVKVQRPGIHLALMADIQALRWSAWVGDHLGVWGQISARDTIEAFAKSTERETDFLHEARTSAAIRQHMQEGVSAPRVRTDLTTRQVLTAEWIDGVSLMKVIERVEAKDWDGLRRLVPGIEYHLLVRRYVHECLFELFGSGLFHGDPHPGNVLIARDGMIYLIDFGIVGTLSPDERRWFTQFFEALSVGDIEGVHRYYTRLSPPSAFTDTVKYRRQLLNIGNTWYLAIHQKGSSPAERHAGRFMGLMADVMRHNAIRWAPDHQLFWRCILTLHAVQLRLAPELDLFAAFQRTFDQIRLPPQKQFGAALQDPRTWLDTWRVIGASGRVVTDLAPAVVEGANIRTVVEHNERRSNLSHIWLAIFLLPICILAASTVHPLLAPALALPLVLVALWPRRKERTQ